MASETQPADQAAKTLEEKRAKQKAADPKTQKKRPKEKEPVYYIHSLVRTGETRLARASAAQKHRFKQYLGGGLIRLVRKRPVPLTETMIRRLLGELVEKEAAGILKVTTPDGRRIDLGTFKSLEDKKATAPKPHPPQDSAKNDQTFEHGVGIPLPQAPGGLPVTATPPLPKALQGMPEGAEGMTEDEEPEEPEEPEELEEEDLEVVWQEVWDAWTHEQLKELAPEYGVEDLSGNKLALVKRLVEAGLRVAEEESKE